MEITGEILTEFEYNQIKLDSIKQLEEWNPDLNIENLLKVKWMYNETFPIFYIDNPI